MKQFLCRLALCGMFSSAAMGQHPFGMPQLIHRSDIDYLVTQMPIDLDGDGDIDVLAGSEEHCQVNWYENLGDGVFAPSQVICRSEAYSWGLFLASGVIRDGGLPDLFTVIDEQLYHIVNRGNGEFDAPLPLGDYHSGLHNIYFHDFDGDGREDLILSEFDYNSTDSYQLYWRRNLGDGSLDPAVALTSLPRYIRDYAFLDWDEDGIQDVLIDDYDGLIWKRGLPGGVWAAEEILDILPGREDEKHRLPADWDGDGRADALYTLNGFLHWRRNKGGGDLDSPRQLCRVGYSQYWPVDLFESGQMDLLVESYDVYSDQQLNVMHFLSSGGRQNGESVSTRCSDPGYIHSADFDGDGMLDFIYASRGNNKIVAVLLDGDGRVKSEQVLTRSLTDPVILHVMDVDEDGREDIVTYSSGDHKIAWYRREGIETWGPQQTIFDDRTWIRWTGFQDIDEDGDTDIVFFGAEPEHYYLIENLGGGHFSEPVEWLSSPTYHMHQQSAFIDFDGDGLKDLIFWRYGIGLFIRWHRNLGGGEFEASKLLRPLQENEYVYCFEDIDQDGRMDILVRKDGLKWLHNSEGQDDMWGAEYRSIDTDSLTVNNPVFTDVDHDGDKDLLISGWWEEGFDTFVEAGVLENLGGGAFAPFKPIAVDRSHSMTPVPFDINGDGHLDVMLVSQYPVLTWHINDGSGDFTEAYEMEHETQSELFSTLYSFSLKVAIDDLNGDGHPDMLVTSKKGLFFMPGQTVDNVVPVWPKGEFSQCYPNPFNPYTRLVFDLESGCRVKAEVFNSLGQKVTTLADEWMESGTHKLTWISEGLPSGVYLCRLKAGDKVFTRKMVKVE